MFILYLMNARFEFAYQVVNDCIDVLKKQKLINKDRQRVTSKESPTNFKPRRYKRVDLELLHSKGKTHSSTKHTLIISIHR